MATQEEWAELFNRTQGVPQASSGGVWNAIDSIPTRINSAADSLAGSIDTARASIAPENITRNIDSALSPLSRVGSRATNALSETANVISQDVVGNGFNAIRNANPDNIIHSVGSTLSSIPSGVKEFAGDIASGINPQGIIPAVKTGLRSARDAIGETASIGMSAIGTAGRTFGRGIGTGISNTFSAIGSVGRGFLDAANGYEFNSGNRFERFGSTIGSGYRGALDAFSSGMSSIGSGISSEASSLRKRITSFPGTAADKFGSIGKSISTGIDDFRNLNPDTIINSVIGKKTKSETIQKESEGNKKPFSERIRDRFGNVRKTISDAFSGIGDKISGIGTTVGNYFEQRRINKLAAQVEKEYYGGKEKPFSERIRDRFGKIRTSVSDAFSGVGDKISNIKRPHLPSLPSLPSLNIGGKLSSVKDNISTAIGNTKTAISNRFSRSGELEGGETSGSGGKTSDIEKPGLFSRIRDHFSPGKDDYGNYSDIKKAWKKAADSDDARIERFSSVAQSRKEAFDAANKDNKKYTKIKDDAARREKMFNDFIRSERKMIKGNDKEYMQAYGSFLNDTRKTYNRIGKHRKAISDRRESFSQELEKIKANGLENTSINEMASVLGGGNTERIDKINQGYHNRAIKAINEERKKANEKLPDGQKKELIDIKNVSGKDSDEINAKVRNMMQEKLEKRNSRLNKIENQLTERQGRIMRFDSDAIAGHKVGNGHFKGKVGAVVGLLALGGIIGNQFAGGHQTNAQLYNPSPQPQYYS